jgi:alpha-D-xyloside xylohydrolase
MTRFRREGQILVWQENQQQVWLQPCGVNGLRVQANLAGQRLELPQALLDLPPVPDAEIAIDIGEETATIRNGLLVAEITHAGLVTYRNARTGETLLAEAYTAYGAGRRFDHVSGPLFRIEACFTGQDSERFWGLGQHQHGRLDQKGCVIELQQRNTEVSIPFLVSNRGYGFLWNSPAIGRVELGMNGTRWVADGARQMDYYLVCGDTSADILARYADATGHAPALPDWATGFWQCKLRYETQEELLQVAREYQRRSLPISVIVIDFFHWSHMGDWGFDPTEWPDPSAMVRELQDMGIRVMVSNWPTAIPQSENYAILRDRGLLINNEQGVDAQHVFIDKGIDGPAYFAYYDATNPEGRRFHWDVVKRNYYDHGIKLFWLDNDEPDINPWHPGNVRFHLGNGLEVANIYPLLHQQAYYDGLRAAGETDVVTLSRSGWAGSQRMGAIIWSGDVASDFAALATQVRAGLNMAMSGIPWWTTDIGGFHGADIRTPEFRELIVRWFQYGVFCPICRLHGYRQPAPKGWPHSGADNEVWSFGEDVYAMLRDLLALRERLRPYIDQQMRIAAETGLPPMRPLFVDFPADPACETVDDQYLFGPDLLVAPVLEAGARERRAYLPAGADWVHGGATYTGGQWVTVLAPIASIPVFARAGSDAVSLLPGG